MCGAKHRKAAQAGLRHAVKRGSEASRAPASSVPDGAKAPSVRQCKPGAGKTE